jgi:hypothetical protein
MPLQAIWGLFLFIRLAAAHRPLMQMDLWLFVNKCLCKIRRFAAAMRGRPCGIIIGGTTDLIR